MDLIRYSDHYFARYAQPTEVEVDALLVSLAHSAGGTEVRLRSVEPVPLAERDVAMADDLVAGNAAWFPDNGLSDADVRARLSPTLGAGDAMAASVRFSDAVTVFRDGRSVDFGDVRPMPGQRVRARLANVGVRIHPDQARGAFELRWLNLTPMRMLQPDVDAEADEDDPPEEVCVAFEDELRARASAALDRACAAAARLRDDADELVAAVEALPDIRGTAEWRARADELVAALESPQ